MRVTLANWAFFGRMRAIMAKNKKRVLIMGAAGRDFHNFNVYFRDNKECEVVCFTATQIPNIEGRKYPKELSGKLYPKGIMIFPEEHLAKLIKNRKIDEVIFSYSDVSYKHVMQKASVVMSAGAKFIFLPPEDTMVKSKKPMIAVCATRTGCGKSQTTRKIARILKDKYGLRVVVIRHPMPYGDLKKQIVQRFATKKDLELHNCTIEEREEYEHLIEYGITVYAGIDYELILRQAEKEADVILWDGGNNDTPFYKPDVWITVADPLRVGHEREYYPGELNFIKADTIVINKYKQATKEQLVTLLENIKICNPTALVIRGASIIKVDNPADIKNKKVVIIEDGPTLTHGNMTFGAGTVAARQYGARVVDPRKYAIGSIARTYVKYPQLEKLIPALGYYPKQLRELEQTVNAVPADIVLVASPTDLTSVIDVNKPMVRVSYSLEEIGKPNLITVIEKLLKKKKLI